jgi:hypothetical protein
MQARPRISLIASAQAKTRTATPRRFPKGMCSVTAVRLDSSSPRDHQPPKAAGQPAGVSNSIQTPPSTSLGEQGESIIPRYG